MGLIDFFRPAKPKPPPSVPRVLAEMDLFYGLKDPRLAVFLRGDGLTHSGGVVNEKTALRNTTVIRCVSLISFAVGTLPLHLRLIETKEKAVGHPLFRVLHRKPNPWQTAFEFRSLMQQRALCHGNAYARVVRSPEVQALIPIDPTRVIPKQRSDWQIEYEYSRPDGGKVTLDPEEVFHLRYGISEDGITGLSLVKQAAEAIGLAMQTDRAAARLFTNGMLAGGALKHPGRLSPESFERLKASMEQHEGADMAHKWLILEEGMDAKPAAQTGEEAQQIETRKHQIEDIARPFGVPRPLLGIDDTSWGTGIDVLGQFFVRYALNPWFEAWQQAIERSLLTETEVEKYEAKFNPGGLLRGSMTQQADFFSKGLGAGGHAPYLEVDEVRDWLDLPHSDNLPPMPGAQAAQAQQDTATQTKALAEVPQAVPTPEKGGRVVAFEKQVG